MTLSFSNLTKNLPSQPCSSLKLLIPPLLSVFLLLIHPTSSDFLSPLLSPFIDDVCKDKVCGKGTCKASVNHTLSFECECDQGWKQTPFNDTKVLSFLPCVVPNCSLDHSCAKAGAPSSQVKEPKQNTSFLDPCNWAYCGEGSCMKKSAFEHECQCREGYANLLNVTTFPCFNECSLGMDCENLGLTVSNKSATPNTLADSSGNNGSSLLQSNYIIWMMTLMIALIMVS